jgi:hypothetical protein
MAIERRKDNKNRVLKEGEYQRASGTYARFRQRSIFNGKRKTGAS